MKRGNSDVDEGDKIAYQAGLPSPHILYMTVPQAALFQIALVIFLGGPESLCRNDLGCNWFLETPGCLQRRLRRQRRALLLWRVVEDHRPVLRTMVWPLPVHLRRIVQAPERFHQLLITHLRRVKFHLDYLGMPRAIRAHVPIRGVVEFTPLIAGNRVHYPGDFPKRRLDSPEATCAECGFLRHLFLLSFPRFRLK